MKDFPGRDEVDAQLNKLSRERLPPAKESQEAARQVIDEIVRAIQKVAGKSKTFRVARTCVAGSFGKGTAIQPEWDIDLVAFIGFPDNQDGHAPPFPEVLSAFQDGLLMQFDDKVSLDGQTKFAIKVTVKHFKVDILVAPDLTSVVPSQQLPMTGISWAQRKGLMAEMEDAEDFAAVRPYSCAFAESVVSFFKKQSQFVHNVVRLCRAWAKVLYLSKPPFSLMYLVELVATHSAQQAEMEESQSCLYALDLFLRALYDYRTLNVVWFEQYQQSDVDHLLLQQRPLLMDPSNPFNNVCESFASEQLEELREFAGQTLLDMERKVPFAGLGPIFSARFSPGFLAPISKSFGSFKKKIRETLFLGHRYDNPDIAMKHMGFPYVTDNLRGNYSATQLTDMLSQVIGIKGQQSLAAGIDVNQGTEEVMNVILQKVFNLPAIAWIPSEHLRRQIEVVVPLTTHVAVLVSFDLE